MDPFDGFVDEVIARYKSGPVPCPFCEEINPCRHDLNMLRSFVGLIDVLNDEADAYEELGRGEPLD